MSLTTKHLVIQAFLLAIWLAIITTTNTGGVASQTPSCNIMPGFMNFPPAGSWPAGKRVHVKIDDAWNSTDRSAFEQGIRKWNPPGNINCSGVIFDDFSTRHFSNPSEIVPNDTIHWIMNDPRTGFNGVTAIDFDSEFRTRAARVWIKPGIPNQVNGTYYVYLGTHEVGHTFNLDDCLCGNGCVCEPEKSIMSGHSNSNPAFNTGGPLCGDNAAVDRNYCPDPPCGQTNSTCLQHSDCCDGFCDGGTCQIPPVPTPTPETESDCTSSGGFWNFTNGTCYEEQQYCPHHCVPYQPIDSGGCNDATDYCVFPYGCPYGTTDGGQGCCCYPTPVIVDVAGDGLRLTNAYEGVRFDLGGDGHKEPTAWTFADSDDAWLSLDRNGNGQIDNGKELFGNFTGQPNATSDRNGFLALAEFDRTENGGNGNRQIDNRDAIFANLLLWRDDNHNGISESSELHALPGLDLNVIELDYKLSERIDRYGNQFRYRSKVKDVHGAQIGRWAWDVIIKVNPPPLNP